MAQTQSISNICIDNILYAGVKIPDSKTPKNQDWKMFNPQKDLLQIGKSGKVFINRKPKKVVRKWEKDTPEGADFFYVQGLPLFRLCGMTYWFSIGDWDFDIRTVRKFLKLENDFKEDRASANPLEGLKLAAFQLDKALQKACSFHDITLPPEPPRQKFQKIEVGDGDELPF